MRIISSRVFLAVILTAALSACGSTSTSNNPPDALPSVANDADNTARNERDSTAVTTTPPDQAENATDLAITAQIRKAVVADDSLSLNAHNVKIITSTGVVTLRGPVKSVQEKTSVEAKAKQVAGVTRVDNLIEIEANR